MKGLDTEQRSVRSRHHIHVLSSQGHTWLKDDEATHCKQCEKEFSISRRKVCAPRGRVGTQLGSPSSGSGTSPWDKPSAVVTVGVLAHSGCPQSVMGLVPSSPFSDWQFLWELGCLCTELV